ncbi:MAG: PSD1 and planctomycete cytochrome C domain-containing protein [Gemmataceae bacterium]
MKPYTLSLIGLGLLVGLAWADAARKLAVGKLPPAAAGSIDFQRDIQPILAARCLSCHDGAKQRGGLRLDDGKAALEGSNAGPVLVPGNSAESRLIHVIAGLDEETKMPPTGKPLTAAEVGKLRAWIDQGAKFPESATTTTPTVRSDHWSFQPIQRPDLPPVKNAGWVRNPIDIFILAQLEKENVQPSPEADRQTLIRRLSLDLLGFPPSPEEVTEFVQDTRPDAYERLVDRMLASPHYGERWARHWLDLARYADSDGFEKDTGRPFAWRYRHWVIDALNQDMPFDQFTIEQLAGDLLPNATVEQKVATGFHRNTLTNKEGGVDQEQFRVEAVVDRVNTTASVFLGLTLACAQCHDHKYEPLSQREYYQFFAFFNSDREVDIPAPLPGDEAEYRQKKAAFDKAHAVLIAQRDAYQKDGLPAKVDQWEASLQPEEMRKLPANIQAVLKITAEKRTASQQKVLLDYHVKTDSELAQLNRTITNHARQEPKLTQAQTLALGSKRDTHVMIRGDFLRPGVKVEPGVPAVIAPKLKSDSPNRLDLARWLVDADNPLTARVIANWMWYHHFGRGLVPTLEDFGIMGERPSHPELLDWLASEFKTPPGSPLTRGGTAGLGWSMKEFHKLVVTSATYRQSSRSRPELASRDPNNVWLSRQNRLRLPAEVIRDSSLASSGLLSRKIGGPSVRPPQPEGISELTYANSARWVVSSGEDRYRRGLYIWFQRTSPYPMLMTFDAPDSNVSCTRRERTNTPLQALTLLNDVVFVECAQALGKRLITDKPKASPAERIRHAYQLCLARAPNDIELAVLRQLFDELYASSRGNPEAAAQLAGQLPAGADAAETAAWIALARTVLNLDEFITRE